jgi:magnesium and cobalt transporter
MKKNKFKAITKLIQTLKKPRSKDELKQTLKSSYDSNLIDADSLMMIEGVINFSDLQSKDVMIPRSQVTLININDSLQTIIDTAIHTSHSRFPVYEDDLNNIIGILLAKDLLKNNTTDTIDLRDLLRPAVFIPESKKLNVLLKEFRSNRNHMAIVVDEYAGFAGILTIEDVLEQIVGDIEDEYDYDESEDNIIQEELTQFRIKATTEIEEFNEYFKTNFASDEFQTVGGLVIKKIGYLPKGKEEVHFDGFDIKILRADSRRLYLLRFNINITGEQKDPQKTIEL